MFLAFCVILLWPRLPDLSKVTDYRPDLPLRVFTAKGTLIGEFGVQRRAVVPYDQVPKQLKQAVLAAEDSRFFEHGAIDFAGVARAALADFGAGGAVQGASTITMQVARDFYLSPEKTPLRKFVEALLAYKIENTLSKDQILDRYINQVYLGQRAYGFAAAAQVYYGKPLTELSLAQMAVLAGLPQAPSAYNPQSSMKLAVWRQHYVLGRMLALGDITRQQYEQALAAPLNVLTGQGVLHYSVDADYAAEAVRELMVARFGEAAYTDGYKVTTTLVDADQTAANAAVRAGLLAYDRHTGWRGPEAHVDLPANAQDATQAALRALKPAHDVGGLKAAVVLSMDPKAVVVIRRDGQQETISGQGLDFCRTGLNSKAPPAKRLRVGSLVRLHKDAKGTWSIVQLPLAQSALVSLQPQTGAVQAWVGASTSTMRSSITWIRPTVSPAPASSPLSTRPPWLKGWHRQPSLMTRPSPSTPDRVSRYGSRITTKTASPAPYLRRLRWPIRTTSAPCAWCWPWVCPTRGITPRSSGCP